MTAKIPINHEQVIIDKCLEHFGEAPPLDKLGRTGKWTRFGAKKSKAIKLYDADDGGLIYLIMDHKTGERVKGCTDAASDREPLTAEELQQIKDKRLRREAMQRERASRKAALLSGYAVKVWHSSIKPTELSFDFAYLVRKGEPTAKNARFFKSHKRFLMVLPMVCPFEGMKSLYLIDEKGFKRPLKGTAVKGLMMSISDIRLTEARTLWVCEGYVTGLSLFREVGEPVVIAFTAGNLLPVVAKLVQAYPNARLRICADNDLDTLKKRGFNPGVDAAKKVQEAFPSVEIFIPEFPEDSSGLSDFNDLVQYLNRPVPPLSEDSV